MTMGNEEAKERPTAAKDVEPTSSRPMLIVGLGNPEPKYLRTPHNLGFLVLDELQKRWGISRTRSSRVRAEVAERKRPGRSVVWLMAPLTYMNLSGEAVRPFCAYYDIPPQNVLVICDDHDLPWGRMRFRTGGSGAGHKGLASLRQHLGTDAYGRLRIGIRPANPARHLADYVLSPFWGEAKDLADPMIDLSADAVDLFLAEGPAAAMNRFNGVDLARTE